MKNARKLFATVFALMLVAMICFGQTATRMIYNPAAPSSLWSIAIEQCGATEATAAAKVAEIQEKNPWTRESWRQFKTASGGQGVLIYPSDKLDLTGLTTVKALFNNAPTGMNGSMNSSSANQAALCPDGSPKGAEGCKADPGKSSDYASLVAALLGLAFLAYLGYLMSVLWKSGRKQDQENRRVEQQRELETATQARDAARAENERLRRQQIDFWQEVRRDPVTSGIPQVPGGIRDEQHAAQTFGSKFRYSGAELIGTPRRVRVTGIVGVCYAGAEQPLPRQLNRHRCYMGNIRRGTDIRAELMMQACGNDIRFGQIMGYNLGPDVLIEEGWEDAAASTETPTDQPTPAATAAQPQPPTADQTPVAIEKPGDIVFRAGLRVEPNKPHMIEMIGVDHTQPFSVEVTRDGLIRIRYAPAQNGADEALKPINIQSGRQVSA